MESVEKKRSSVDGYRTPLGKLARRLKSSVGLWKEKYRELKRDVKRFRNRAADAQRSRDHWREQAEQLRLRVATLEAELAQGRGPDAAGGQTAAQKRGPS